jgi:arylsulfatase A-like enzyme
LPEYRPDLTFYEQDAELPCGGRDEKYSQFFQSVTRTDAQIMRVLDKLKELRLYDHTMIVVVSDHGCQWWEHEHMYYVSHLYEQSLQVPLIVKVPGIAGGVMCNEPVLQLDVLPTVMDLAGVCLANPRADYPLPGRSLVPLMAQEASEEQLSQYRNRDLVLTTHYDTLGVISGFRDKLIFDRPTGTYWLFDLVEDPMERHNLVDDRPELLEAMLQRLREMVELHPAMIGSIAR